MGCGPSSLKGDDYSNINADSPIRRFSTSSAPQSPRSEKSRNLSMRPRLLSNDTSYTSKPQVQPTHYESPREHEKDLKDLASSQRRPSRPAYVDNNEDAFDSAPLPAKDKHWHKAEKWHKPEHWHRPEHWHKPERWHKPTLDSDSKGKQGMHERVTARPIRPKLAADGWGYV